jgi:hypothetical protein
MALFLLLGLAVSCAATIEGKKIDAVKNKQLLAADATTQKVVQMYGEPQLKENLASGETMYVYYYRKSSPFTCHAEPREQQRLEVYLKNNIVQKYRYSEMGMEPITKDIAPLEPEKK